MLHEYGGGVGERQIAEALALPLAIAFALYAAIGARYDMKPTGPTYQDREVLAALAKTKGTKKPRRKK